MMLVWSFDHGNVLLRGRVGGICRKPLHLIATAVRRNTGINNSAENVPAMIASVKTNVCHNVPLFFLNSLWKR
jgi:hypothetical protein